MEDGIERMMTPELYNIHYIDENKKKTVVKELNVKELNVKELNVKELNVKTPITTTKNENELKLKDIKESTNSQSQV